MKEEIAACVNANTVPSKEAHAVWGTIQEISSGSKSN
jgi:hypothetical protein